MRVREGFRGYAEYYQHDGFTNITFLSSELFPTKGQAIDWSLDKHPDADEHSYMPDEEIQ